jgi:hypothetical protein
MKKMNDIIKLETSYNHILALQKCVVRPISDWTPEEVSEFISRIGFPEASKLAIYNKVDGKMIENFDEEIWVNTFGLIGINELQKIRYEIG